MLICLRLILHFYVCGHVCLRVCECVKEKVDFPFSTLSLVLHYFGGNWEEIGLKVFSSFVCMHICEPFVVVVVVL